MVFLISLPPRRSLSAEDCGGSPAYPSQSLSPQEAGAGRRLRRGGKSEWFLNRRYVILFKIN
ncbi:hypothetical protein L6248_01285 [Candidatus Parcubacteria bacterium]|nr:hypothetical protein [Candidatus Parcubacteria bacterium]MCG2701122.1 hypothetical protein [Candidatus Parcubacteria bacterium]